MFDFENPQHESKNSLENTGQLSLSFEETDFLKQESQGEFVVHPKLAGVEIRSLSFDNVPVDVREKIEAIGGRIVAFTAIRIKVRVPLHQHVAEGEICFGGDKGVVTLYDSDKVEIGKFDLGEKVFTSVNIDGWHIVESKSEQGTTFFGVKFAVDQK